MMDKLLQANSIGVGTEELLAGQGVRIMMTSGTSEGVVCFDMYPSAARRHALRILQACEIAEGRLPVNS